MNSILYFSIDPERITREEWTSYPGYTFVATLSKNHQPGDEVKGHLIRGVFCRCDPAAALNQAETFRRPLETLIGAVESK